MLISVKKPVKHKKNYVKLYWHNSQNLYFFLLQQKFLRAEAVIRKYWKLFKKDLLRQNQWHTWYLLHAGTWYVRASSASHDPFHEINCSLFRERVRGDYWRMERQCVAWEPPPGTDTNRPGVFYRLWKKMKKIVTTRTKVYLYQCSNATFSSLLCEKLLENF